MELFCPTQGVGIAPRGDHASDRTARECSRLFCFQQCLQIRSATGNQYNDVFHRKPSLLQDNAFIRRNQCTQYISIFSGSPQSFQSLICIFLCHAYHHTNAHVKGVEHVVFRNVAGLCNQIENRKNF